MPKALTKDEFVQKAVGIHGGKYDYSKTAYLPMPQKIAIKCPEHGVFMQKAGQHLIGKGCPACGNISKGLKVAKSTTKWDTASFVTACQQLHPGLDFSETIYKTGRYNQVSYRCPKHGIRETGAYSLLNGHGCIFCAAEARVELSPGWSRGRWVALSKNGVPVLYIIKCWNEEEQFFKVGITFRPLTERFHSTFMPYNYEPIALFTGPGNIIHDLEGQVKSSFKHLRYEPRILFNGQTECYSNTEIIEQFLKLNTGHLLKVIL